MRKPSRASAPGDEIGFAVASTHDRVARRDSGARRGGITAVLPAAASGSRTRSSASNALSAISVSASIVGSRWSAPTRSCASPPVRKKPIALPSPSTRAWILVIEWPEGAAEPDHYWLATLQADISLERMVDRATMRWRIERDYLELKQEVGLGHYEGRGWRGFHHHATLCIAAYGFLISEKETIPPSGPPRTWRGTQPALPAGYRPRGSAAAFATPHTELNRNLASPPRANIGARTAAMSLLRTEASEGRSSRMSDAVRLEHLVPLSRQAVAVITAVRSLTGRGPFGVSERAACTSPDV